MAQRSCDVVLRLRPTGERVTDLMNIVKRPEVTNLSGQACPCSQARVALMGTPCNDRATRSSSGSSAVTQRLSR